MGLRPASRERPHFLARHEMKVGRQAQNDPGGTRSFQFRLQRHSRSELPTSVPRWAATFSTTLENLRWVALALRIIEEANILSYWLQKVLSNP